VPSLTVVVPLYNKERTITRCLRSILAQTFPDFEVVVIDDGSTDNSPQLVRALEDPRIRLIHQPNAGAAAARNRGIAEARTDLIALLDADDTWDPTFLETILSLVPAYPEAGIYATGIRRYFGNNTYRETTVNHKGSSYTTLVHDYFLAIQQGDFVCSSNIVIPKAILNKVGGFPVGVVSGEDRDLWARIAAHYPIACDARILATYYTDQHSADDHVRGLTPYPAAVLTTRALLEQGTIPSGRHAQIRQYMDWLLLEHVYSLAFVGDRQAALHILNNEPLSTVPHRWQISALKAVLPFAPLAALRGLPLFRARLRRVFRANARQETLVSTKMVQGVRKPD